MKSMETEHLYFGASSWSSWLTFVNSCRVTREEIWMERGQRGVQRPEPIATNGSETGRPPLGPSVCLNFKLGHPTL